jgi:hypothetical protein
MVATIISIPVIIPTDGIGLLVPFLFFFSWVSLTLGTLDLSVRPSASSRTLGGFLYLGSLNSLSLGLGLFFVGYLCMGFKANRYPDRIIKRFRFRLADATLQLPVI